MKNHAPDFAISTPPELRAYSSCLGWCAKAVDSLADRVVFNEFRDDFLEMNEIFEMNNPDVLFRSAELSAMIASCSFIYIQPPERAGDIPELQVIDGANATGEINPVTGLLYEGYAVLERDDYGIPTVEAYFEPNKTTIINKIGKYIDEIKHRVDFPLLVPIIYRPGAKRPFGHSRISRACMSIVNSAARTVKRSEISAEFFSFPQKWASGFSEDVEMLNQWSAAVSAMMIATKDEDGDSPSFGQFMQQSMTPHTDQLRMFASLFAGETGLTLDDLGFATENPSSAEAIKASHETLRLTARKAQRNFASGFLNVGYLAACMRDEFPYQRRQLYMTRGAWEPIFEPDMSTLSLIGDGALKINQAVPGYFGPNNLKYLTGIKGDDGNG